MGQCRPHAPEGQGAASILLNWQAGPPGRGEHSVYSADWGADCPDWTPYLAYAVVTACLYSLCFPFSLSRFFFRSSKVQVLGLASHCIAQGVF